MSKHDIFFVGVGEPEVANETARILWRDYDFNRGDDRELKRRKAFARAKERSRITQRRQQVRRVCGPLSGQHMWLIQTFSGGIEIPTEKVAKH